MERRVSKQSALKAEEKGRQGFLSNKTLSFCPLTSERWDDLERLFGLNGACAGCWCMWWRQTRSEFDRLKGRGNKEALKKIVDSGEVTGLIAFVEGRPAGWCALAPRERYARLETSRILKPVDDTPVWSVVCFFVARPFRRKKLTLHLLRAAQDFARELGASVLEGYPVEPRTGAVPDAFAYTGLASAFREAGFKEVARRSPTRPVMRYEWT